MRVTICDEIELKCQICQHNEFVETISHAATWTQKLFSGNYPAHGYVCERCGYVHWFLPVETD